MPTPRYVPDALTIGQALSRHSALGQLQLRLRQSNACFDAIREALPGALVKAVQAGPVDDAGWTLLAANAAVAAKLRQLQPRLEDALRERGLAVATIRIKVLQQV
ncbi:DciA family protein [Roseateles toxinivorans]|uniref:Uncharacterized protein DUF721 n=1 Tax=Roseateles toxinivorans TaxID=270368 RepID=A0A4R6QL40_9BURK|nr:DciA family protein [Roseateles toxinivorans]TDP63382.1 uncharacterized protein DUF721 [Roseateles toxinivorans]